MLVDLNAAVDANQAQIDLRIADLKAQVEMQSQEAINQVNDWMANMRKEEPVAVVLQSASATTATTGGSVEDQIRAALAGWGFNADEVETWIRTNSEEWVAMEERHQQQ